MKLRSLLSAAKVFLGINPRLSGSAFESIKYIPLKYRAVCLISADLELAWAFVHSRQTRSDIDRVKRLAMQTRDNIPQILDLCDKYNIPITWAVVGHLFVDSCSAENGKKHANLPRIPYFNNEFWEFNEGDWYDSDPCETEKEKPEYYGKKLIADIQGRNIKHEIACHTFSHIDCSDERCPKEVFEAEIMECQTLAGENGIELKSFVHPGHFIGHLDELHAFGFESFRTNNGDILGFPSLDISGLWQLENTAELVYRKDWSDKFNFYKFKRIMERAIKRRKLIVFWFHPSFDKQSLDKVLTPVLQFLDEHRSDIWVTTHKAYTDFLKTRKQ